MGSPAFTGLASATLTTWMLAQLTVIVAMGLEVTSEVCVDCTLAALLTVPQVAEVVGELMWTVTLAPAARSPMVQVNTPPLMGAQVPAADPPFTDQLSPGLPGRLSVMVTPWANPAPVLLTV